MLKDKKIMVDFFYPETDATLKVELPASTLFEDLTEVLYAHKVVIPQQPGYAFVIKNHLCGGRQCLADYLPSGAASLTIQIFGIPQIMI